MKTWFLYQVVLLLVLSTLIKTHVETKAIEGRIISGSQATPGQFPYHVLLKKDEIDTVLCGGSIISNLWVLTAAHCTNGLPSVMMVFGTIYRSVSALNMTSNQIFIHPQYNPANLNNDVSLIQLPTPLSFTSYIQPISLVTPTQAANGFLGDSAIITGYGYTDDEYLDNPETLLWAQVEIVDNSACLACFTNKTVNDKTMCAKGYNGTNMSICSGDSGGALVWQDQNNNYVQIGINSFVAEDMCTENYPSGYVKLSAYLDFIASVSGISSS
ncbi:transmembrane protease serine 9-like [Lucilia sericata]|uniref:transmembrane protease serine 9-like n=1 Tax=Lucilia sericata TaxID=13632 RepID=UPI0018A8371D|nr:transmembrane protease serine 9-like [Lucilia sericata]